MTYRAQPPGPTQQEAAPALSEGVIWFVGQVRGSGKRRQESARGSGRVDVRGGRRSVLQHRLVALEHTLGNFWSSALQRHLREREHRRAGSTSFHFYARPSTCKKDSDRQINAEDARCGT